MPVLSFNSHAVRKKLKVAAALYKFSSVILLVTGIILSIRTIPLIKESKMKIPIHYWERLDYGQIERIKEFSRELWNNQDESIAEDVSRQILDTLRIVGKDQFDQDIVYRVSTL